MKIILFLLLASVILTISRAADSAFSKNDEMSFDDFAKKHNKKYHSIELINKKKAHYLGNMKKIKELNEASKKHKSTVKFTVNEFSDYSFEEFASQFMGAIPLKMNQTSRHVHANKRQVTTSVNLPTSFGILF